MSQNTPPHWNLSSIYTSFVGDDWKNALAEFESRMNQIDVLLEQGSKTNDFPMWLGLFLQEANTCGAIEESLNAFAYSTYSTDTTNADALNNISMLEEKGIRSQSQNLVFRKLLTTNSQKLPEFYTRFPQFATYKYILQEEIQEQQHQMSEPEENLAFELQRFGGSAWSRLHEQIISNLIDPKTGKTFNEIRNEAYLSNRQERYQAWKTEIELLKANEIPLAACLNNIKGATISLNKRRNWQDAISRSLSASRISKKTLEALLSAMNDSLPFWRDYLQTKAKILGLEKCAFYDLFAPIPLGETTKNNKESSSKWTFQQAKEYIINKFSAFSNDMGEFARFAFENDWIDAEVRVGKVGGAFCIDFPTQKVSRVLSNFTGVFSDVTTLAHELGHAYHHWCIKDLDYSLTQYPMTLAETASVFAETIIMKDILANTSNYEKRQMIETHLSDCCQVIVDILSRYYFEQSVFEERKIKELGAEDFCALMKNAQEKTYGDGLSDERHPYIWAVKTHYYSPDLDFYNFPYAFGLLFALGLYAKSEKEGPSFAKTYTTILQQTGKASCEEVCSQAGFDITTPDFWKQGLDCLKSELAELKTIR